MFYTIVYPLLFLFIFFELCFTAVSMYTNSFSIVMFAVLMIYKFHPRILPTHRGGMFYLGAVSTNWSPLHSFYKHVSQGCRVKKPTLFRFSPPQYSNIITHDICWPNRKLYTLLCRLVCTNQLRNFASDFKKFHRHLFCHYFANQLTYGYWANIHNPFVKNPEGPHGFSLRQ